MEVKEIDNKRGPKTKEAIKYEILLLKKHDNKLSAKKIRRKLLKLHPGSKYIPKERAIQNIIKKNEALIQPEFIDSPWTVGTGMKYPISPDSLTALVWLKHKLSDRLTIRIARWFSYLFPTLYPIVEKQYRDKYAEVTPKLGIIYQIAKQYAKKEEIHQMKTGEVSLSPKAPDTADIDEQYLIKGDLAEDTIWSNFIEIFLPKTVKMWEKEKRAKQPISLIEQLRQEEQTTKTKGETK